MQKNSSYFFFSLILIILSLNISVVAQTTQKKVPISQELKRISNQFKVFFNYKNDALIDVFIVQSSSDDLNQIIKDIEEQTNLIFTKESEKIYTINLPIKVCGFVKDYQNLPLVDATVQGESNNTITNNEGYFEIVVSSLNEKITIRFLGYENQEISVDNLKENTCLTIQLEEKQETISQIIINSYLTKGIDKEKEGAITVDFSKFSILPGLTETDALQAVQALPGIQSTDETVSNINIRGGSNDQNLILWDGIKMYQSGHFFGLISSFNPEITNKVTIVSNGSSAAYTDGVSGTLLLNSDTKLQKTFKGNFIINLLNVNLFLDTPLGSKSSLQIAGRRSTNDLVKTPIYNTYFNRLVQQTEVEENVDGVVNSNQSFSFYDTSLRWLYQPSSKDKLRLNFLLINNDLIFDETAVTNTSVEAKESSLSQNSLGFGLNYKRNWTSDFSSEVNVYNTDYTLKSVNSNVLSEQQFILENVVSETGIDVRGDYVFNDYIFSGGYQFVESEITNLKDVDQPRFLRLNSKVVREHAFFIQTLYDNNDDLIIKPGIRFSYIGKFKKFFIEPRLLFKKKLNESFQLEILGELKHQNTSQIINFENDFLGVEKRTWQLTDNDSIPILRSKQISLGLEYKNKGWLLDATGYYKEVDGITSQSQGFTTKYEFEEVRGNYSVSGLDFLLRKQFRKINTWLSYSYMFNKYFFDTLPEQAFPSNFDIRHSFTFGAAYEYKYLRLATGVNYRVGNPTSIPIDVTNNQINFGEANSARLNDYVRLDTSVLYKFEITDKLSTEVGVSVWNVLDRENTISNFYRLNNESLPVKFSKTSLNRTTNAMVRFSF